jgi:hypothetical protein
MSFCEWTDTQQLEILVNLLATIASFRASNGTDLPGHR